ncbi:MAG TPA: hypothetical protein VHS59_03540 [Bacillota bacterium]|nr:hypothetical protein [Bacillota bacterium]
MSSAKSGKQFGQEGIPFYLSSLIVVLVLAFVGLGVFTYYKWNIREPVISPQEANLKYLQQLVEQRPKDAN